MNIYLSHLLFLLLFLTQFVDSGRKQLESEEDSVSNEDTSEEDSSESREETHQGSRQSRKKLGGRYRGRHPAGRSIVQLVGDLLTTVSSLLGSGVVLPNGEKYLQPCGPDGGDGGWTPGGDGNSSPPPAPPSGGGTTESSGWSSEESTVTPSPPIGWSSEPDAKPLAAPAGRSAKTADGCIPHHDGGFLANLGTTIGNLLGTTGRTFNGKQQTKGRSHHRRRHHY